VYKPAELMVPPVADQVTALFVAPVTVAVNCCILPVESEAEVGDIDTDNVGALTVTVAEADLVVSAALVAVTVSVPPVLGAVYKPLEEIVPPVADQVTAVFAVPVTMAVNCCVRPVSSEAEVGEIVIETNGAALTVTVAEADLVVSAALVAVTV
jgi:hypothetical protein